MAPLTIRAGGAVVWRDGNDGVELAVVHRPRYDDWSLPKGKAHGAEPAPAAARREIVEETGYDAALGRWLGRTHYRVEAGGTSAEKRVDYWVARAGEPTGPGASPDEIDEVRWLAPDVARKRLSWDADRELLARFLRLPPLTTTVVLVRHAHAGSRTAWRGPDAERPLDDAGRAQVAALAGTLPSFWLLSEHPPVVSAPVRRCVETVEWAGDVVTDERLSEHTYADDPRASVAYVRELARQPVTVACSQGGIIPGIIETLRREDGLRPAGVRASKGSAWVLSFSAGRLVAADYVDAG